MGYGWMAGLGQAMQQVGSEQVPQYLARRRQADQDKQAAEQRGIENALAGRRATVDEGQLAVARAQQAETAGFHTRTLDEQDRNSFFTNDLPTLYGKHLEELGQPQRDAATKYGIHTDANGMFVAPQGTQLEMAKARAEIRSLGASAGESTARASALTADSARAAASEPMSEMTRRLASIRGGANIAQLAAAARNPMTGDIDMDALTKLVDREEIQDLQKQLRASVGVNGVPPSHLDNIRQRLAELQRLEATTGGRMTAGGAYDVPPPRR